VIEGAGAVAVLAGAAVLLGVRSGGVARRRVRVRGAVGATLATGATDVAGARVRASPARAGWAAWSTSGRRDPTTELCVAVTAVAAELRAGRAPAQAWLLVLGVPAGPDGVPRTEDVVAAVSAPEPGPVPRRVARLRHRVGGRPAPGSGGCPDTSLRARASGVVAATRLATELGAPLAGVLDGCARSLAADADAETAVRAALAGPRQTTTLLTWLPALGVGLGTLLGADALGVLLGGGLGTTAGLCGTLLTLAGRAWVGRMVDRARGDGAGPHDG
jgi:tight adherence protein B